MSELLTTLRQHMNARGIDALYIPTADPHQSEYVADHYQTRRFLTGFDGSAGTAVVTADDALLWTDGRYFIQAARQIENSGFQLMKQNTPGYPSVTAWLEDHLPEGGVLAFNGATLSESQYDLLAKALKKKNAVLLSDETLLEALWQDRPDLTNNRVFAHTAEFAGRSTAEKLAMLRGKLAGFDGTVMSSLENIGWLMNFRGSDIDNNPVAFAYAVITPHDAILYLDPDKYDDAFKTELEENGVSLKPYGAIFSDAAAFSGRFAVDKSRTSHKLYAALAGADRVDLAEHVFALKAVLNETEEKNLREAWLKDGVALTRFLIWLEDAVASGIDEYEAAEALSAFRAKGEHYLGDSFDTISAYADSAPMMHYRALKETAKRLEPHGFYLVDSGGQYLDGSTDITRTIALGTPTEAEKRDYTLVLKAHINLASAVFLYGASGHYLDVLARQPLWREHIDYKSGTGHAMGYVSGVHEGPQRIAMMPNEVRLEPNMVLTIEPGIYREGIHGIRLENVYLVKDDVTVGTDRFLKFDCLSFAPLDLKSIDAERLSPAERDWLNEYHARVYDYLAPRLTADEAIWLKEKTKAI